MPKRKCEICKRSNAVVNNKLDLDGVILKSQWLCLKCYKKETKKENAQLRDKNNLEIDYDSRETHNQYNIKTKNKREKIIKGM